MNDAEPRDDDPSPDADEPALPARTAPADDRNILEALPDVLADQVVPHEQVIAALLDLGADRGIDLGADPAETVRRAISMEGRFLTVEGGIADLSRLLDGTTWTVEVTAEDIESGFIGEPDGIDALIWWLITDDVTIHDEDGEATGIVEVDSFDGTNDVVILPEPLLGSIEPGPLALTVRDGGLRIETRSSSQDAAPSEAQVDAARSGVEAQLRAAKHDLSMFEAARPTESVTAIDTMALLEAIAVDPQAFREQRVPNTATLFTAAGYEVRERDVAPAGFDWDELLLWRSTNQARVMFDLDDTQAERYRQAIGAFHRWTSSGDDAPDEPGRTAAPVDADTAARFVELLTGGQRTVSAFAAGVLPGHLYDAEQRAETARQQLDFAEAVTAAARGVAISTAAFRASCLDRMGRPLDAAELLADAVLADAVLPDAVLADAVLNDNVTNSTNVTSATSVETSTGSQTASKSATSTTTSDADISSPDGPLDPTANQPASATVSATLLQMAAEFAADRGDARAAYDLLVRQGALDHLASVRGEAETHTPDLELLFEVEPFATSRPKPEAGRNDPCPCGSGKKYKKCHLGSTTHTVAFRAPWLHAKATRFARSGASSLIEALAEHITRFIDDAEFSAEMVWSPFVADLALHEGGVMNEFLDARRDLLPADEVVLGEQWLEARRSVFRVEHIAGDTVELTDLDDPDDLERLHDATGVADRSGGETIIVSQMATSSGIRPGDLMIGRPLPVGDAWRAFGGFMPVAPGLVGDLLDAIAASDPIEIAELIGEQMAPDDDSEQGGYGGLGGLDLDALGLDGLDGLGLDALGLDALGLSLDPGDDPDGRDVG